MSLHSAIGRQPGNYSVGWDSFTPSPGEVESMNCLVCGDKMKVKRAKTGPTSFAEAMSRKGHLHDHFFCKNSGTDWHNQLLDLKEALRDTPSRFEVIELEKEIKYILKDRKPTLEKYTEADERSKKFQEEHADLFPSKKPPKKTG